MSNEFINHDRYTLDRLFRDKQDADKEVLENYASTIEKLVRVVNNLSMQVDDLNLKIDTLANKVDLLEKAMPDFIILGSHNGKKD